MKIQKKIYIYIYFFFLGGWGGQGGCERRSEALVKIQKKNGGGGEGLVGGGEGLVRGGNVNREVKLL